jgi:hypothetical protein
VNDERRQSLERFFDGEAVNDDPRVAADEPEADAYLRQLGLLRELARRHDPASACPPQRSVVIPPRPGFRKYAAILALAASLLLMVFAARRWPPGDRVPHPMPVASPTASPNAEVVVDATVMPRSRGPSVEVKLYRWANAESPRREDAARIVLARVEGLHARPASREVLALELANSMTGSVPRLARSVSSHATTTPGSSRRPAPSNRNRPAPSPRA